MPLDDQDDVAIQTPEQLLAYIVASLPKLWSAQERARCRELRTTLNAAERMRRKHERACRAQEQIAGEAR